MSSCFGPVCRILAAAVAYAIVASNGYADKSDAASTSVLSGRSAFPAHWWETVPKEKGAWWEILPQEAGAGEVILSKRNELGLLSNFAATPFEFRGQRYASLEGFWQMMKYPEGPDDRRAKFSGLEWKLGRADVAQLTAFEAKR